jgi:hypothetical protein
VRRRDRNSAYQVVLDDLKAQRDELDRMIRLLEAKMAAPTGGEAPELPGLKPAVVASDVARAA